VIISKPTSGHDSELGSLPAILTTHININLPSRSRSSKQLFSKIFRGTDCDADHHLVAAEDRNHILTLQKGSIKKIVRN
jgi:hypothetical protein